MSTSGKFSATERTRTLICPVSTDGPRRLVIKREDLHRRAEPVRTPGLHDHQAPPLKRQATVDDQRLPGDPGRVLGHEEGDRAGDVLGLAQPTQRILGRDLLLPALVERLCEPGLHHGRRDGVDPHQGRQLDREALGEADHGRLAGAVERDPRRGPDARYGRDVDHRPASLGQPRAAHRRGPAEGADHIHRHHLGGRIVRDIEQRAVDRVRAGVVHQDVDLAERGHRRGDGVLPVVGIRRVAGDAERDVRAAEFGDGLGQRLRPPTGDHHPRTLGHQSPGDGQSDAATGAGDDRHPPRQPPRHRGQWPC